MPRPGWEDEVLKYWFDELTLEDWYRQKDATDRTIRERFLALHADLGQTPPDQLAATPDTALAAVIVFDQFPRNMFRKQAAAFATDALAIAVARGAIDKGFDVGMDANRRQFLYMPFMHSEVLADQERCVKLFEQLDRPESLKYAVEHRDIIARFGRFPHRNRALGRESTPAETEFLQDHSGFGQ